MINIVFKRTFLLLLVILLASSFFASNTYATTISNGMNAAYVIGDGSATQDFTDSDSGLTASTFNQPRNVLLDSTNNRLFVSDSANHRVLVFNTDANGVPLDYTADNVLGQADFVSNTAATSQTGMNTPTDLAYDSVNDRLFVSMAAGASGRIMVYDVATIDDGEAAINVLGQENFTDEVVLTDADGLRSSFGIDYDPVNDLLFVSDKFRVLVFDVAVITDGEDAVHVLGKPNFTSEVTAVDASTTGDGSAYVMIDSDNDRLFVNDQDNHRVLVFDVATIVDGEAAVNILGQVDFTSTASGTTASTFTDFMALGFSIVSLSYDSVNDRLFAMDVAGNRVLVFDVATIDDGEAAVNVLGQTDFVSATAGTTQSQVTTPFGGKYNTDVEKYYVADYANNRVLIYDLAVTTSVVYAGNFTENVANDGSVDGSRIATVADDTFVNAGSTLTLDTHYSLSNAPAGLTPVMTVAGDGLTATLTFTGNATDHEDVNDVIDLTITFLDGAFTNTPTAADATEYTDNIGTIDFEDAAVVSSSPERSVQRSSTPQSKAYAQEKFAEHYGTSSSDDSSDDSVICSTDQQITQNLKSGARNGRYHSYTGGIVTEAHILQAHLNRLGFESGPEDGILGPISDGAIKRMQAHLGTIVDGYVGPLTRALLNESCGSDIL